MKKIKLLSTAIIMMIVLILNGCSSEKAIDAFEIYKDSWEDKDYKKMYSMLSEESKEYISEEDFINRYTNIYDGIDARDISINMKDSEKDKETIEFSLDMVTLGGEISQDYQAKMVKDKDKWTVDWDESLIFPQMEKDDEIRINISKAKRGEIYDRFGNGLEVNGLRYSVGIHPYQYDDWNNVSLSAL